MEDKEVNKSKNAISSRLDTFRKGISWGLIFLGLGFVAFKIGAFGFSSFGWTDALNLGASFFLYFMMRIGNIQDDKLRSLRKQKTKLEGLKKEYESILPKAMSSVLTMMYLSPKSNKR